MISTSINSKDNLFNGMRLNLLLDHVTSLYQSRTAADQQPCQAIDLDG